MNTATLPKDKLSIVQRLLQLSDDDIGAIVDSRLDAQLLADAIDDLRKRDVSPSIQLQTADMEEDSVSRLSHKSSSNRSQISLDWLSSNMEY